MSSTTTCAALHDQDTIPNGSGWYKEELAPNDGKIYIHIDGPSWNPVLNGSGRWFGNFCPKNQREARDYYNLPGKNPASHLYKFRFVNPKRKEIFCIFGSSEKTVDHWQAKFPAALIDYIQLVDKFELPL